VALFDEMSYERKDVGESEKIIEQLELALASGNRVEIFPNLKSAWVRISVTQNKLVTISQSILDAQARLAFGAMSDPQRRQWGELREERRALETRFGQLPRSQAEYDVRRAAVASRFARLRRESFHLEQNLKQAKKQLQAMERWVGESRYRPKAERISPQHEARLREQLSQERDRLRTLFNELANLKQSIEREQVAVSAGDATSDEEQRLRERLLAVHKREAELLEPVIAHLPASERAVAGDLDRMRKRVFTDLDRLRHLLGKIDKAVESKVAEYRRQLAIERRLVAGYKSQVNAFEGDSDRLAHEIGSPLLKQAQKRLSDVVLEADLGLVDVAWKRKQREADKIADLQKAQTRQLNQLEQTMKGILKD
jgi:chromosome segregation ATPase